MADDLVETDMISSKEALSMMLKKKKYAQSSPITEATMETMYRIGNTMLAQRAIFGLRTSERNTITLAIAMYTEAPNKKICVISIPEISPALTSSICPGWKNPKMSP
jgi:hypothetical protein